MKGFTVFDAPLFSDNRGETIPFEFDADFPFVPKRMYLVTSNNEQMRGGHAHITEKEVFIAAQGSITAILSDGKEEVEVELNAKNKALFVDTHCWHEFVNFSDDAVLLCLSSVHYTPGEENYIMNKNEL